MEESNEQLNSTQINNTNADINVVSDANNNNNVNNNVINNVINNDNNAINNDNTI